MLSDDFRITIGLYVTKGFELLTGTFFPQIEKSSTATEYEPYVGGVPSPNPDYPQDIVSVESPTITVSNGTDSISAFLPYTLQGIPVDADGNYTDSHGQQWICDELIYNADGTGKVVKRTAAYTITEGINVRFLANAGSYQRAIIPCALDKDGNVIIPKDGFAICSAYRYDIHFRFAESTENIDDYAGCFTLVNGGIGNINMRFVTTATTAEQFISENLGVKIIYQRAEPQEIQLTAEEMTALKALQMFDGITNFSNDKGAEMSVKYCTNSALSEYVKPIKTGLQKQIDELKSAVLSLGGNV